MPRSCTRRSTDRWIDRAIIAVVALMGVMMLLPFLWLFSMSFRPAAQA